MGYFWIFIYFLFVVFIITFFSWSTIVLHKQKKAWAAFAKRHGLRYRSARFMDPSAVDGTYQDFRIGLFSEAQVDTRGRGVRRYRTIIEVLFGEGMPSPAAIGNTEALPILNALNFGPTFHPKTKSWNNDHIITTADRIFIEDYLTDKRLERLNGFLNMPRAAAMFVFDEVETFIRVETADPMTDVDKIEKFIQKLIPLAQELRLSGAERVHFYAEQEPPQIRRIVSEDPAITAKQPAPIVEKAP